ncbi:MAG: S-layer homology domain-containing protein [Acidobacteria bacterium]|nr:S-layer homology domain-containing protein [Acidobacteriota bacterium]
MLKRHQFAVTTVACVSMLLLGVGSAASVTFDDVPSDHWAAGAIDAVTDAGIMNGCGGSFFCPYGLVTRREVAAWLVRVDHYQGGVVPPDPVGIFEDVPQGACQASWIEELWNDGTTRGCNQATPLYCPEKIVTRAEIAVFILRLIHGSGYIPPLCTSRAPEERYVDVPCPNYWAADWIEEVHAEGLSGGCLKNPPEYCPTGAVNRAQAALFLARVMCKRYGVMCAQANGPSGGAEVVGATLDDGDEGHEVVGQ